VKYASYDIIIAVGVFGFFFVFIAHGKAPFRMPAALFRFAVGGMFIAKTAVFFYFHAVWVVLFFLGCVVVALLAVLASQSNFGTHLCPSNIVLITKKTSPFDVWVIVAHLGGDVKLNA